MGLGVYASSRCARQKLNMYLFLDCDAKLLHPRGESKEETTAQFSSFFQNEIQLVTT